MRPRRFQGATIAEAYERVRDTLGDDAVIISTRQAAAPGLFGFGKREFVEVVAGIPEETPGLPAPRPFSQDAAAHDLVRGVAEAAATGRRVDLALPAEPPQRAAPRPIAPALARNPEPALAPPFANAFAGNGTAGLPSELRERLVTRTGAAATLTAPRPTPTIAPSDSLATLAEGLSEVRALVERLSQNQAIEAPANAPGALAEVREQLVAQGVAPQVLVPLLDRVASSLSADASVEAVRLTIERRLAAQLPPTMQIDLARRPAVCFVVGPAGSGKTTFALQLALQLQQRGLKVAIAGIAVERAGAPQQLQAAGAAAGVEVHICYTPAELQALIADSIADVTIVDTPGHSAARRERLAELTAFTQIARERSVLLALPATTKGEDLQRLTEAYAAVKPTGVVLTRCDETQTFGALLSAASIARLGVAYTTHDDALSATPRAGDNHALAAAIVHGRWPDRAAAGRAGRAQG